MTDSTMTKNISTHTFPLFGALKFKAHIFLYLDGVKDESAVGRIDSKTG
jgi:hypothetical protein